ncbi:MAG: peptidoglycan-binding domain-containing protein, partial [Dongiaceae bacterium]
MSKRYLLAGASALMLALAVPVASMAQTSTVATMPYSVAAVQRALNDLGYTAGPVDGLMGSRTRGAIRAYQIDKGLPVSGEPSRNLYEYLQKTLMAGTTPAPTPGLDSTQIAEIQTRLRDRGYNLPYVNGSLDASTVAAIRAFQGDAGLPVTGQATTALLDQLRIGTSSGPNRTLTRAEVVRLQSALNERGYAAGPEDGVAGPKVRAAIRTYQADAGLPITGEATHSLLAKLESGEDDVADDTPSDTGGDYSSRIAQVEGELQRRGYYVGDVDGEMDDRMRLAIRAYQGDAGLPVTGEANAALLDSLKTSSVRNRSESNSLLVWEIENQLERLGYAVGEIDGTVDDQARLAIMTYQRVAGIRHDGKASFALLDHIEQTNARNSSQTASLLIWNIETELQRRGYKTGPIDGAMDQQTAAAIRDYEDDAG